MHKVVAIIPCFNEAKTVGKVIDSARCYVDKVVVVDDGSTDGTARVALASGAIVISQRNKGVGAATRTGILRVLEVLSDTTVVVLLDGDAQHDPRDIPKLVDRILAGYDLAVGVRLTDPSSMPFLRRTGNRIFSFLLNVGSSCRIPDGECGFRAAKPSVLQALLPQTEHFGYCQEMVIRARAKGYSIASVFIHTQYGDDLHKYRFWKQLKRGIEIPLTILKWRWLTLWEQ